MNKTKQGISTQQSFCQLIQTLKAGTNPLNTFYGLLKFIGYGNPSAPLWFVGAEEGLGGKMSAAEEVKNLEARCNWSNVEDLCTAHLTLVEQGKQINILDPKRKGHTVPWRFMSRIALAAEGSANFNNSDEAASYMREKLGRTGRQTFLTELRPIPAKHSSKPVQLPGLIENSVNDALKQRQKLQLEWLRDGKPRIVICYGRSKRKEFATHFQVEWKQKFDFFEVADDGRTFLLPFLGNGQMSAEKVATFVDSGAFKQALNAIPVAA